MQVNTQNIVSFFSAITANNVQLVVDFLNTNPTIKNESMPYEYLSVAFEWFKEYLNFQDVPIYFTEAVEMYLKTKPLDWALQSDAFDVFMVLLESGAFFAESEYLRAIEKVNFNQNDKWLIALLKHKTSNVPFSCLEYSLVNFEMTAFNILCKNGCSIFETEVRKIGSRFHVCSLFGKVRSREQVDLLLKSHLKIRPGDILSRLQNICIDLDLFDFMLTTFVTEFSSSHKMLELFDIDKGRFIPNLEMTLCINKISWNQCHRGEWMANVYDRINKIIGSVFISLQLLSYNAVINKGNVNEVEIAREIFCL